MSKALQLLRSLQIVETGRRRVMVLDLEALRARAQLSARVWRIAQNAVAKCVERGSCDGEAASCRNPLAPHA